MKEVMLVIMFIVLIVSGIVAFTHKDEENILNCKGFDVGVGEYTVGDLLFQGPVQEGYDECIFRLTGEHKEKS